MISFPNVKINIGLDILSKRADGYHNIESLFYPLHWQDALEILPSEKLQFTVTGLEIPEDSKGNLCLQAYQLLKADFDISPVHIYLYKNIPIGAGLGGGSADAAFTLKSLNDLFKLSLSEEQLENYARRLGSDCAFFIQNKAKFCFNKGDEFEEFSLNLQGTYIVLVYPNIHISSKEAYSGVIPSIPKISLKDKLKQPLEDWEKLIKNDFEKSLFIKYPILEEIKNQLYVKGAIYASMTGSGSTIYGIFQSKIDLKAKFLDDFKIWYGEL